jgi:hypothetical protein
LVIGLWWFVDKECPASDARGTPNSQTTNHHQPITDHGFFDDPELDEPEEDLAGADRAAGSLRAGAACDASPRGAECPSVRAGALREGGV